MAAFFLACSLSPNQFWIEMIRAALRAHTQVSQPSIPFFSSDSSRAGRVRRRPGAGAYHPIILLRINMAAMGSVEEREEDMSAVSPLTSGSW